MNKCILCGKCVRVCERCRSPTRSTSPAAASTRRSPPRSTSRSTSTFCRFCGQCVDICPTGAIANKQLKGVRTWDRKKVRTTCPFCGVGCNFDLNVAGGKVVGVTAAYDAPANQGSLCVKGRFHTDLIYSPDRITTPLIKKDGVWENATWDEALEPGRRAAARDPRRARQPLRRRPQLGALHQRGELPAAAPHAGGPQHEQYRSLRPYLTRSHGRRSGHHAGFRRDDQLDRRDRRQRRAVHHRVQRHRGAPDHRQQDEAGASARRQAHRRRPAAHGARRARPPLAAAQAGHGQRARQRHAAHHHHATAGTTRSTSTSAARASTTSGRPSRTTRRSAPRRSPACRPRPIVAAAELYATTPQGRHLLHARHHRAHGGHGQRHEPRQPRHDHRPHRRPERRREPHARPEQRAGLLRHGRPAQLVPGLPERARLRGRRRSSPRPTACRCREDMGLRIPEMFELAVHGTLKAMFIMGEDPALTDADANHVRKALGQPRLPRRPEHLHDRDGQVRRRVPAGGLLRGEGRHVHQHRAPRAARAQGRRAAGRHAVPTGRSSSDLGKRMGIRWHYDSPEEIFEEIRTAGAAVRRHDLRAPRHRGPAVARARPRTIPARRSCTRASSRAARGCCRASRSSSRPS